MNGVVDDQYKVPLIAKLLHSLPHYNITFHRTNNTFRPTDEVYLEVSTIYCNYLWNYQCPITNANICDDDDYESKWR